MRLVAGVIGALFMISVGQAAADETSKRNAMHHVATVLAAVQMCPDLQPSTINLALLSVAYGFTIEADSADGRLIMADAKYQIDGMKELPRRDVCMSALLLYGEGGLNVPGLLVKK